jgi:hypothetical protein
MGNKKFVNAHEVIQIYHNKNIKKGCVKQMHQYGTIKNAAV